MTTAAAAPLTKSALLDLCDLPPRSSDVERLARLETLRSWRRRRPRPTTSPSLMDRLVSYDHGMDAKTGCMPLHWMAGTGFDEAIDYVLGTSCDVDDDDVGPPNDEKDHGNAAHTPPPPSVDQLARKPSTGRTPLHYAARNGHMSTCILLIEKYGANPRPIACGGVTPLQLAVWQNRLDVVAYLVERAGVAGMSTSDMVLERNEYDCGLSHWVGLIPRKRWRGDRDGGIRCGNRNSDDDDDDDGSGVIPLARYLHSHGASYDSSPANCNAQGHTPAHKAAWGGNLPLLRYYRDEFGVYDTVQDVAGNYCADIARMRGNADCHTWLLEHANGRRVESYAILGLDVEDSPDLDDVRRRFLELARESHPDRRDRRGHGNDHDDVGGGGGKDSSVDDFVRIRAAYEHLTKEGGFGAQKNPKYDELKLLEDRRRIVGEVDNDNGDGHKDGDSDPSSEAIENAVAFRDGSSGEDDDDLFMARLIAMMSDYGDSGFPVALIARRWNQIWPNRPFPSEYVIERTVRSSGGTTVIRKRVKLVKWLRWKRDQSKCTTVYFRNVDGVVLAFDRSRQGGEGTTTSSNEE